MIDLIKDWPGEICKKCGRRNNVGFKVSDDVWEKVVGDHMVIWCPFCFDSEAQIKGIKYQFEQCFLVSWSDWVEGEVES